MNVVDLHPEDLIDKLERGSLSADERARLEAHLGACAECRFEISVRADLADEALLPRARPEGPVAPAPRASAARRSLPPRRALLFPAIAAALVAGGALAAVVSEVVRARPEQPSLHRMESPLRGSGTGETVRRGRQSRAHAEAVKPDEDVSGVEPALANEGVEPPAERAVEATTQVAVAVVEPREATVPTQPVARRRAPPSRPGLAAVAPADSVRTPAPTATAEKTESDGTAAGLFGAANRARRYGDTGQAVALYRTLQARFPGSEEARLSRATLAALELDRGDPGAALDGFDRYLEQGGSALGAEALVGRAVALQKLGKSSEELAAWKEVARRFPGTAHARRAAARVAVLSGR